MYKTISQDLSKCLSIKRIVHYHCRYRQIHASAELPPWPRSRSPTPYEIFNTTPARFDKAEVKKLYMRMARVYHPDSKMTADGTEDLSPAVRADRFKKLVAAYTLLKDDQKRREWDNIHQRFDFSPSYRSQRAGASAGGSGKFYGPVGYGRMRDDFFHGFENDEWEANRRQNDEKFQEKLRKNRNQLTLLVMGAVIVVGYLQVTVITGMSEKQLGLEREMTFRARLDEINAQTNYGRGSMQDERIARFLATRQSGSYYNKYEPAPLAIEGPKER